MGSRVMNPRRAMELLAKLTLFFAKKKKETKHTINKEMIAIIHMFKFL